jgi:hypothetical protein
MAFLPLPVHKLGGRNRYRLISKVLNRIGQDEADGIEEDVDPLIVLEIERGGSVRNVIKDSVREMISYGDCKRVLVRQARGEKDLFFFKGSKISHSEKGTPPLPAKGLDL